MLSRGKALGSAVGSSNAGGARALSGESLVLKTVASLHRMRENQYQRRPGLYSIT